MAKQKVRLTNPPKKPLRSVTDGWESTITGLGRSRDKRSGTTIKYPPIAGSRDEYDDMYHGDDTAATIAELPAREMTRQWVTLSVEDSGGDVQTEDVSTRMLTAKQVMQALDDIESQSMFAQAILWARVHGGSLLFLGVDDGVEDLSQPLNMDAIKSLDFLLLFDRWEVQIMDTETELNSSDFGKPKVYMVQAQTESGMGLGVTSYVHASRFIRFDGVRTSRYRMAQNGGWSDSIYTRMRETLQDYGISWHGVAHLLQDFSQAVLKMRGLADAIAQQESNVVLDRMTAMDLCRSVARAIPIDAEDEDFKREPTPMGGLPETLDRLMLRVASAARMPATLLFGQSPAGLNATGESDIQLFYDGIKAQQEEMLRPRLDRLFEVLFAAREGPTRGKEPERWSYDFNPLWQESDSERATVRKTQAETDAIYLQEGVVDIEEIAMSRFGGDGYSTETVLDMQRRMAVPDLDGEPAAAAPGEPVALSEAVKPEDTLNGAQVTAMVDVIRAVQLGEIPKMAAQEVILAAFPLDDQRVGRMFSTVVEGGSKEKPQPVPPQLQPFQGGPQPPKPEPGAAPDWTIDWAGGQQYRTDRIEQRGSFWAVLSEAGEVLGTHESEELAQRQLRAIEAEKARG